MDIHEIPVKVRRTRQRDVSESPRSKSKTKDKKEKGEWLREETTKGKVKESARENFGKWNDASHEGEIHRSALDFDDQSFNAKSNEPALDFNSSSSSSGTAPWVFITVGVVLFIVLLSTFIITLMYRRRHVKLRKNRSLSSKRKAEPSIFSACDEKLYNEAGSLRVLESSNTWKEGSYRYAPPPYEDIELREYCAPRSALMSDSEIPLVKVMNTQRCNAEVHSGTSLLTCMSTPIEEEEAFDLAVASNSFLNMCRDDGNKLRGGNGDFHRKYVDVDYIHTDTEVRKRAYRPNSLYDNGHRSSSRKRDYHGGQQNSCSSNEGNTNSLISYHSARSIISIPPTSPSENYVEVGSDDISLRSQRSTPPITVEWLTKSFTVDAKNDLGNYQSNSETQTEGSVSSPMCKTVFGTSWQFGGTFTNHGGRMQAKGSDILLTVVSQAIPKGEYVDIYGAIFTDTPEIRRKFEFPLDESLITPVVEYHTLITSPFQRHVRLQLPHALPEDFDPDIVKVYSFSIDEQGKISLYCLPLASKLNEDGFWGKGRDGCSICISTTHFSGYFCTMCRTSSLPSVCTMVFGSHVQMTPSRREIRVILYVWDRRLTIKDYLERFRKQESDVDRQLLTDMQIPLLDDASSSSRLLMRLETMGEDDQQCWRHVCRPNGSRALFKPLQIRKLNEIVHCCRQTDPIRVEWALENMPQVTPGNIFQCCIDIMHVPETIKDYEAALREDSDDLMRTFYVRDLKVTSYPDKKELRTSGSQVYQTDLKRTLSEAMDMEQTENFCKEYGITPKDIGNFRKKYSSGDKVQIGLLDECLRRYGPDVFIQKLPGILEKLRLFDVLQTLEDQSIVVKDLGQFTGLTNAASFSTSPRVQPEMHGEEGGQDDTRLKSVYHEENTIPSQARHNYGPRQEFVSPSQGNYTHSRERPHSPSQRNRRRIQDRSTSPPPRNNRPYCRNSDLQHLETYSRGDADDSEQYDHKPRRFRPRSESEDDLCSSPQKPLSFHNTNKRCNSPNMHVGVNEEEEFLPQVKDVVGTPMKYTVDESYSNDSDSVFQDYSFDSRELRRYPSSSSRSTVLSESVRAQAGSPVFVSPRDSLDDCLEQTRKKELVGEIKERHPSEEYKGYPEIKKECNGTNIASKALPSVPRQDNSASQSSPDCEQTLKKERYGMSTTV